MADTATPPAASLTAPAPAPVTATAPAPTPARLDAQRLRADFPILATTNRFGKPLVYLDSAATSLKPQVVIDAVDGYNGVYSANIHRGIYEIAERATGAY